MLNSPQRITQAAQLAQEELKMLKLLKKRLNMLKYKRTQAAVLAVYNVCHFLLGTVLLHQTFHFIEAQSHTSPQLQYSRHSRVPLKRSYNPIESPPRALNAPLEPPYRSLKSALQTSTPFSSPQEMDSTQVYTSTTMVMGATAPFKTSTARTEELCLLTGRRRRPHTDRIEQSELDDLRGNADSMQSWSSGADAAARRRAALAQLRQSRKAETRAYNARRVEDLAQVPGHRRITSNDLYKSADKRIDPVEYRKQQHRTLRFEPDSLHSITEATPARVHITPDQQAYAIENNERLHAELKEQAQRDHDTVTAYERLPGHKAIMAIRRKCIARAKIFNPPRTWHKTGAFADQHETKRQFGFEAAIEARIAAKKNNSTKLPVVVHVQPSMTPHPLFAALSAASHIRPQSM